MGLSSQQASLGHWVFFNSTPCIKAAVDGHAPLNHDRQAWGTVAFNSIPCIKACNTGHGPLGCAGQAWSRDQPSEASFWVALDAQVQQLSFLPYLEVIAGIPTGASTDFQQPFISQLKINGGGPIPGIGVQTAVPSFSSLAMKPKKVLSCLLPPPPDTWRSPGCQHGRGWWRVGFCRSATLA